MDNKQTRQISNEAVEAAIKEYVKEQTKENLKKVVNLLRPSLLMVPAMVNEEKQAVPLFLKNSEGTTYLAVFTGKEQIPENMRNQTVMVMPFPVCNGVAVSQKFELRGIVVNPYTDNLILKIDLIKRLYEADKELAKQLKQNQKNPATVQLAGDVRSQVEYQILPNRLYTEGEAFVQQLCEEKEAVICRIFTETYGEKQKNPYTESDFSVMALNISEELTLIRIDLPGKAKKEPFCYRVYITYNPQTKKGGYYTIEKVDDKKEHRLGTIREDGMHQDISEAPVEGVELQEIIGLAQGAEATEE